MTVLQISDGMNKKKNDMTLQCSGHFNFYPKNRKISTVGQTGATAKIRKRFFNNKKLSCEFWRQLQPM